MLGSREWLLIYRSSITNPVKQAVLKTNVINASSSGQWNIFFIMIISGRLAPAPPMVKDMMAPMLIPFAANDAAMGTMVDART